MRNWSRHKERLQEEQNHRCAYCGVRFGSGPSAPTVDHVRPRSAGGSNCWENLIAACYRCNQLRGDENAYRFFELKGWTRSMWREVAAVDPAWVPSAPPKATLAARWPEAA